VYVLPLDVPAGVVTVRVTLPLSEGAVAKQRTLEEQVAATVPADDAPKLAVV
jgi:hypothetical protein